MRIIMRLFPKEVSLDVDEFLGYHADDGKVFAGSGAGAPFGPRCHKGDIMVSLNLRSK